MYNKVVTHALSYTPIHPCAKLFMGKKNNVAHAYPCSLLIQASTCNNHQIVVWLGSNV